MAGSTTQQSSDEPRTPLSQFVGRAAEVEHLQQFIAQAQRGGANTLLIEGEPGIGKTRLLAEATRHFTGNLVHVKGIEAEGSMPLAGLSLLTTRLAQHCTPPSEAGQPTGLPSVAELVAGLAPASSSVVGMVLLEELVKASAHNPLVVVIDDAHWLDEASVVAIVFALRRLHAGEVTLITTTRTGLPCAFRSAGCEELHLEGLDREELTLLAADLNPEVVSGIHELVRGNPMAFLAVLGTLSAEQRSGVLPLDANLIEANVLDTALKDRIGSLPQGSLDALALLAAQDSEDSLEYLSALSSIGRSPEALIAPEEKGLIRIEAGAISFAHPLMRTAIISVVGTAKMREAHATLADLLADDVRAAWHLASAAAGPEERAANALEAVAQRANSVGAPKEAGAAFARAATLTADPKNRYRREYGAALGFWMAGEPALAKLHVNAAITEANTDGDICEAVGLLSDIVSWSEGASKGIAIALNRAHEMAEQAPGPAALLATRGGLVQGLAGDSELGLAEISGSVDLAMLAGAPEGLFTLAARAGTRAAMGLGDLADEDLAIVVALSQLPIDGPAIQVLFQVIGMALGVRERHEEASELLGRAIVSFRRGGFEGGLAFTGALASEYAFRGGRFAQAVLLAQPDIHHDRQGSVNLGPAQAALSRASAVLGRHEDAFRFGEIAQRNAAAIGMETLEGWAVAGLGLAHLASGNLESASEALRRAAHLSRSYQEPSALWYESDLADVLLLTGELDRAAELGRSLAKRCERSGTRYGAAVASRIQGVVGEDRAPIDKSIEMLSHLDARFEVARSRLALAEYFEDADAALAAATVFERCGAPAWAERAWLCVGAASVQGAQPGSGNAVASLSPAELRVAACVAQGRSNKEVANDLCLSAKTVDAHLQSIYRKLGIRNRVELSVLMADNASDTEAT